MQNFPPTKEFRHFEPCHSGALAWRGLSEGSSKYFREFPSNQESVAKQGTGESEYLFSLSSAPLSVMQQLPVANTPLPSSQQDCGLDWELVTENLGSCFPNAGNGVLCFLAA